MRYTGRSTGMSLFHYVYFLLKTNEDKELKLTDEAIVRRVKDEFKHYPQLISKYNLVLLSHHRSLYNLGRLHKNKIPRCPSFRYDEKGGIISFRGNALSSKAVKRLLQRQKERYDLANSNQSLKEAQS